MFFYFLLIYAYCFNAPTISYSKWILYEAVLFCSVCRPAVISFTKEVNLLLFYDAVDGVSLPRDLMAKDLGVYSV